MQHTKQLRIKLLTKPICSSSTWKFDWNMLSQSTCETHMHIQKKNNMNAIITETATGKNNVVSISIHPRHPRRTTKSKRTQTKNRRSDALPDDKCGARAHTPSKQPNDHPINATQQRRWRCVAVWWVCCCVVWLVVLPLNLLVLAKVVPLEIGTWEPTTNVKLQNIPYAFGVFYRRVWAARTATKNPPNRTHKPTQENNTSKQPRKPDWGWFGANSRLVFEVRCNLRSVSIWGQFDVNLRTAANHGGTTGHGFPVSC